jgi:hypothetical protein
MKTLKLGDKHEIKKGDYVKTPRFLTVRIEEVFENMEDAWEQDYKETTHYKDDGDYEILGKHIGTNRMIFGAIKKESAK